jgi:hypothetical protein
VPREGLEPPMFVWLLTKQLLSPLSHLGEIVTTAHTPAVIGDFPRKNMRFETLPKK